MKTKTKVRAGALSINHNKSGVKTKSKVRAGTLTANHNKKNAGLKVKSKVRAGAGDDWEAPIV